MKSTAKQKYSVVDLFAGAGGLSHGFIQTGRYEIKAAFENNPKAQETYMQNHNETMIYNDVADALTDEIVNKLGKVDVVIGGPPCQGFSNANRQKNHAISQNNSLIKKYVHAVLHLNPTAFIMENVSMLKSSVHRFYVDKNDEEIIKKYNIETTASEILLLDSVFCFDGFEEFEEIVSSINKISTYLWNESDYLSLNVVYKVRNNTSKLTNALEKHKKKLLSLSEQLVANKSRHDHIFKSFISAGEAIQKYFNGKQTTDEAKTLCDTIEASIMYQRMLSKAKEIIDNQIVVTEYSSIEPHGLVAKVTSMAVIDYIESVLSSLENGYVINKGVLSAVDFGVPQKRQRFVVIGIKKDCCDSITLPIGKVSEENYCTVSDAISDLENVDVIYDTANDKGIELAPVENISNLSQQLRDSNKLHNHITTATTPKALERFKAIKQGENFHALDAKLKDTYSDPTRTQNTIYLRLNYNEPSGTVVNVRKSMWIHPVKHRALSVREAARLQTFKDSFVFCGTKDSQYQQVGNAVPPVLAKAIAEHLCGYLDFPSTKDDEVPCDE